MLTTARRAARRTLGPVVVTFAGQLSTAFWWVMAWMLHLPLPHLPLMLLTWGLSTVLPQTQLMKRLARGSQTSEVMITLWLLCPLACVSLCVSYLSFLFPVFAVVVVHPALVLRPGRRVLWTGSGLLLGGSAAASAAVFLGLPSMLGSPVVTVYVTALTTVVGFGMLLATGHLAMRLEKSTEALLAEQRWRADEQQRRSDEALQAAQLDPLTGLPGRLALDEHLVTALGAVAPSALVGVLFCDLDGFKAVNDSFGHDAGDRLLCIVAEALVAALPGQLVARMGGDEFVVVLTGLPDAAAAHAAAAAVEGAVRQPIVVDGDVMDVGVSIGVATTWAPLPPAELMRDADAAMYVVKRRHHDSERVEKLSTVPSREQAASHG